MILMISTGILNYRLNNRLNRTAALIFFTLLTGFLTPAHARTDEALKILERWTSTHWGENCFMWVVHYPEEIVNAWVDLEAERSGMSEAQKLSYKNQFVSELQIYKSETFLLSIYSFGRQPVNLTPVRDNIALINSDGVRIKPTKYNSTLDNPNFGVVQGLIFFPKQPDKNFVLSVKNIADDERIFAFEPPELPPVEKQEKKREPEVVVVNLPKKKAKPEKKKELEFAPPPPPVTPARPITPIFQDNSSEMEDFVNSMLKKNNNNNFSNDKKANAKPKSNSIPAKNPPSFTSNQDNAYISREHLLRRFLKMWADNNPIEMYELLSAQSQKNISRENFVKEINKSNDMREGLKGDYRIDWIGEERAKVIVTRKNLVFKSLSARTLGVTREGSSWKIVW